MDDHSGIDFKDQQTAVRRFAAINAQIIELRGLKNGLQRLLMAGNEFVEVIQKRGFFFTFF